MIWLSVKRDAFIDNSCDLHHKSLHLKPRLISGGITLEGFRDAISGAINSVRYKDAYEDIRRKEEEVEALRKQYEEKRSSDKAHQKEQEKRRTKTDEFRRQQESEKAKTNKSSNTNSQSNSRDEKARRENLATLGLNPNEQYSYDEIKKAYRRMANKWHPDKFSRQSNEAMLQAAERFKALTNAYEWLGKRMGAD